MGTFFLPSNLQSKIPKEIYIVSPGKTKSYKGDLGYHRHILDIRKRKYLWVLDHPEKKTVCMEWIGDICFVSWIRCWHVVFTCFRTKFLLNCPASPIQWTWSKTSEPVNRTWPSQVPQLTWLQEGRGTWLDLTPQHWPDAQVNELFPEANPSDPRAHDDDAEVFPLYLFSLPLQICRLQARSLIMIPAHLVPKVLEQRPGGEDDK